MVGFAELLLAPADYIVFYDGNDGSFLARNNGTPNFTKSVTSNSASIRVVFRSEDNSTSSLRRFVLYYREIPKGKSAKRSTCNLVTQVNISFHDAEETMETGIDDQQQIGDLRK